MHYVETDVNSCNDIFLIRSTVDSQTWQSLYRPEKCFKKHEKDPCLGKIRRRTRWWCPNRAIVLVPTSKREILLFGLFQDLQKSLFSVHFGREIITRDSVSAKRLRRNTRATEISGLKAETHKFLPGLGVQTMEIRTY